MNANTPLWALALLATLFACTPASAEETSEDPPADCPPVSWEGNTPVVNHECLPAEDTEDDPTPAVGALMAPSSTHVLVETS